jgi:hypothetical protein
MKRHWQIALSILSMTGLLMLITPMLIVGLLILLFEGR